MKYDIQPIHKFSNTPVEKDRCLVTGVEIPDGAFSDLKSLAKALRDAKILSSGERLQSFRTEASRVVAFATRLSPWHAYIITPTPVPDELTGVQDGV